MYARRVIGEANNEEQVEELIVTTSREHEEWRELILRLVQILCEGTAHGSAVLRGATWKLKREQKGAESDTSPALPKCIP